MVFLFFFFLSVYKYVLGRLRFGSVFRCLPSRVRLWVQSSPHKNKTPNHLLVVGESKNPPQ